MEGVRIATESGTQPTYNAVGGGFLAGNPGRPKGILDKRADAGRKAAQALAAKAWDVIEEFLAPGVTRIIDEREVFVANDPRLRIEASRIVLEYAHGKPRQSISIDDVRESVEESARERGLDPADVLSLARQIAEAAPS